MRPSLSVPSHGGISISPQSFPRGLLTFPKNEPRGAYLSLMSEPWGILQVSGPLTLQASQVTVNMLALIPEVMHTWCIVCVSCPTICNSMDCSPPGSSVHTSFQTRILEWVAICYSGGSSQPRNQTHVFCVSCIGRQIPYYCATWYISNESSGILAIFKVMIQKFGGEMGEKGCRMEFYRPEYWSGQPFPSPEDFPNPGIEPRSPALQADSLPAGHKESPGILEWVAYPFSSRSSRPRNQTRVSCRQILYQLSYLGSPCHPK